MNNHNVWRKNTNEQPFQSNLANAKTDGLEKDLHLKGNDYSILILLFYIPFGLFDLPWNLLIKRFSGRIMLSISETLPTFEDLDGAY